MVFLALLAKLFGLFLAQVAKLLPRFDGLMHLSLSHGFCPSPIQRHASRPQLGLYNLVAVALGTWGVQRISATRVRCHRSRRRTLHGKMAFMCQGPCNGPTWCR